MRKIALTFFLLLLVLGFASAITSVCGDELADNQIYVLADAENKTVSKGAYSLFINTQPTTLITPSYSISTYEIKLNAPFNSTISLTRLNRTSSIPTSNLSLYAFERETTRVDSEGQLSRCRIYNQTGLSSIDTNTPYAIALTKNNWAKGSFNFTLGAGVTDLFVDPSLSACGTISVAGKYDLTQSINDTGASCLIVSASDVVVNGGGYTIGQGSTAGAGASYSAFKTSGALSNVSLYNATLIDYGVQARTDQYVILITNLDGGVYQNLTVRANGSIGFYSQQVASVVYNNLTVSCLRCASTTAVRNNNGTNNTYTNVNFSNYGTSVYAFQGQFLNNSQVINATFHSVGTAGMFVVQNLNMLYSNINFTSTSSCILGQGQTNNVTFDRFNCVLSTNRIYSTSTVRQQWITFSNSVFRSSGGNPAIDFSVGTNNTRIINTTITSSSAKLIIALNSSTLISFINNTFQNVGTTLETIRITDTNNSNFSHNWFSSTYSAVNLTNCYNNTFWNNTFNTSAGGKFVTNIGDTLTNNQFNLSQVGNRYFNRTEIGTVFNLSASLNNFPWADNGGDRPLNATKLGQAWGGIGGDWFPFTTNIFYILPTIVIYYPNNTVLTTRTASFIFLPTGVNAFGNATLYANFSGSWEINNTNQSTLINATNNTINVSGLLDGVYIWSIRLCDLNGCVFSTFNMTFTISATPPTITPNYTLQCADGSYLLNGNNQYWYYETNGHPVHQCSFSIWHYDNVGKTPIKIFGFVNMTENTTSDWHNATFNLSGLTTLGYDFYAMVNCSFGGNVETHSEIIGLVNSCSNADIVFLTQATAFKNSQTVNNNMQFVVTFGVIALVLFAVYYWLHKRDENKKEDETKDTRKIVDYYLNLMNKYLALILGVTSLAFMFYFSWLGYSSQVIESQNATYSNFTTTIGGEQVTLPLVTSVLSSSTQPLDAGSTTMAEAAVRIFLTLIGVYAMLLIIAQVLKFLAAMQDQYNKRQIGESDDEQ